MFRACVGITFLRIPLAGLLAVAPTLGITEDDVSTRGTHRISYERVQSYGLDGCLLRFMAVAEEPANGAKNVAITGHIVATRTQHGDGVPILGLKIALQDVVSDAKRERPHSAHLRTAHWSTEKQALGGSGELSDDGFAVFGASLRDAQNAKLLQEMASEAKVTIAFKRTMDSAQVLVPVDLTVVRAEPIPGGGYRRDRSSEPLDQFRACLRQVL